MRQYEDAMESYLGQALRETSGAKAPPQTVHFSLIRVARLGSLGENPFRKNVASPSGDARSFANAFACERELLLFSVATVTRT